MATAHVLPPTATSTSAASMVLLEHPPTAESACAVKGIIRIHLKKEAASRETRKTRKQKHATACVVEKVPAGTAFNYTRFPSADFKVSGPKVCTHTSIVMTTDSCRDTKIVNAQEGHF